MVTAQVVLGSTQYEHKVFAGPFARNFPKAKVHVAPDQWAFPLDLPPQTLGIFPSKDDGVLTDGRFFDDEFDVRVLRPDKRLGGGYAACEAAFVHRPTKTLILTDALIKVPKTPPPVLAGPALEALGRPDNYLVDVAARVNWRGQGAELRDATRRPAPADLAKTGWKRDALLSLWANPRRTIERSRRIVAAQTHRGCSWRHRMAPRTATLQQLVPWTLLW